MNLSSENPCQHQPWIHEGKPETKTTHAKFKSPTSLIRQVRCRDKAARFQQTLTRFKQERFAACKHEAPTQLRVNTEQISTWPSHNLTGQHDDMLECACSHEWCIYLHTNTFLLMIRRVVVWFPSTWWPPCGNSGCTHGLGDSKESRHRHLLFYC